jgi:hypothetical protein
MKALRHASLGKPGGRAAQIPNWAASVKIRILGFITETTVDTMTFGREAESPGFDTFYLPEHPIIPVVRKSAYPASADGVMPEGLTHFIDPSLALRKRGRDYPWLISYPLRGIFVLNYVVGFAYASGSV